MTSTKYMQGGSCEADSYPNYLFLAAKGLDPDSIRSCHSSNPSAHTEVNSFGFRPAFFAITGGNLDCVKVFFDEIGDDPNFLTQNKSPTGYLHYLVGFIHRTAINSVARANLLGVLNYLTSKKNTNIDLRNHEGQTAYMHAKLIGCDDAAELLIQKGADRAIMDYSGRDIATILQIRQTEACR